MAKKTLEEIEEQEINDSIAETVTDGTVIEATEYEPYLDVMDVKENMYDAVIFRMLGRRYIDLGVVSTRAYQGLTADGKFYLDLTGCVIDIDQTIALIEYVGFTLESSGDNLLTFTKDKEDLAE